MRLADGTLCAHPPALNGETKVRLGVRPEKLRVIAIGDDSAAGFDGESNVIEGTVLDASYIGVSTQYLVKTADGHTLTVYAQNLETGGAARSWPTASGSASPGSRSTRS